jgi:hypothetical protein
MTPDFTWADRKVNKPSLAPLAESLKAKANAKQTLPRNDERKPRKSRPVLDYITLPKADFMHQTATGKALPPVESAFLEPLLRSKKGKWKPEDKKLKRNFAFERNDPISPTRRVDLLLPHERMYYQKSVNQIQKEMLSPLTYQVQDVQPGIEHGHKVQTLRRPEQKDLNAYKNGRTPEISPLRIVQHGRMGGASSRVVSDNTAAGFGRSSYGGFYSRV